MVSLRFSPTALGLRVASVAPDAAVSHFGWVGAFFGMDLAATSAATQELLGWTPAGPSLAEDIAAGACSAKNGFR